jgi:hypothetical protein
MMTNTVHGMEKIVNRFVNLLDLFVWMAGLIGDTSAPIVPLDIILDARTETVLPEAGKLLYADVQPSLTQDLF